MIDQLLHYVPSLLFGVIGGFAVLWKIERDQYRTAARAAMLILRKAEERGVFFSPHDRSIMNAVNSICRGRKI